MSSIEENKAVALRFFEASSHGDLDAMLACWAPNTINHGRYADDDPREKQMIRGIEGPRRVFTSLITAFPDR